MAFTAGCILQVDGVGPGDDTNNGGGFDPGATFATDLAATTGTGTAPVVTSASYNFAAGDVGAYLFVKSGTSWTPGFYLIASVSSNAATLTATVGSVVLWNGVTPLNTVAGIATVASPTGGTWGLDYSRSTSARLTFTDLAIDGTTNTKFTSAGHPVGVNFVGNFISVTSGTGFTVQRVEVLSVTGTTATCDKSLGTLSSSGGNGRMGGAVASPGLASSIQGSIGMTIFVLGNHTYTLSSTANVSGGKVAGTGNNSSYIGYMTNRHPFNTDPTRPVFQSSGNTYTLVSLNGTGQSVHCIDFENGNANTTIVGFDDGQNGTSTVWNCQFKGVSIGAKSSQSSVVAYSHFENCTGTTPLSISSGNFSHVHDCTFVGNTNLVIQADFVDRCVFYNTTTGAQTIVSNCNALMNCLFHTITGNSDIIVASTSHLVKNCIFVNVSGTSSIVLDRASAINPDFGLYNAFFNCTNNIRVPTTAQLGSRNIGTITLTGDPCVSPSTGDFSLNNTAGAGALLRALAFPATFANGLTTNALDVGPAQHADAAAGGAIPVSGSICT